MPGGNGLELLFEGYGAFIERAHHKLDCNSQRFLQERGALMPVKYLTKKILT